MICRSHNTSCNSQLDEGLPHLDKQLDITEFPGIAKGTASTELIAAVVTVELEKLEQCASRFCTEDTFLKIFFVFITCNIGAVWHSHSTDIFLDSVYPKPLLLVPAS